MSKETWITFGVSTYIVLFITKIELGLVVALVAAGLTFATNLTIGIMDRIARFIYNKLDKGNQDE